MTRRQFLHRSGVLAGAITTAPMINRGRYALYGKGRSAGEHEYSSRTLDLVGRSVVIDMLGLLTRDWGLVNRWHARPASMAAPDVDRLVRSGITVFHPAVELRDSDQPSAAAEKWFSGWTALIEQHPEQFVGILQPGDVARAKSSGRIGILLGLQNATHFRGPLDVEQFAAMGQRVCQLTYNERNHLGTGCAESTDYGLTELGETIVGAMNHSGLTIDLSHCGERTTLDAIAVSGQPVIITHANCKALVNNRRCKSDRVIRALASKGGVMGITSIGVFARGLRQSRLSDVLDHYDHVARLVGVEHVGVGSDTDLEGRGGILRWMGRRFSLDVPGLDHPLRIFELTEGLVKRGYSDRAIELILGENFTRLLHETMLPAPARDTLPHLAHSPTAIES
jgi:membrane dipeptidase